MSRIAPLESNFLIPGGSFWLVLVLPALVLVAVLVLAGVVVTVRSNARARRIAAGRSSRP
jgi:hypothetical protein